MASRKNKSPVVSDLSEGSVVENVAQGVESNFCIPAGGVGGDMGVTTVNVDSSAPPLVITLPTAKEIARPVVVRSEYRCRLCGSVELYSTAHLNVLGVEGANLHQCRVCGFRQYPTFLDSQSNVYDSDLSHQWADDNERCGSLDNRDESKRDTVMSDIESYYNSHFEAAERLVWGASNKHFASVYEVGVGTGAMLRVAKKRGIRWVSGCEINTRACEISKGHGLDVEAASFQDAKKSPMGVECVVMYDVVEHTYTPKEDLLKAHRILAKNGVLMLKTFYDEYHQEHGINPSNVPWSSMGLATSGYFDPYQHVNHFTVPVLRSLLIECGFNPPVIEFEEKWGQIRIFATKR